MRFTANELHQAVPPELPVGFSDDDEFPKYPTGTEITKCVSVTDTGRKVYYFRGIGYWVAPYGVGVGDSWVGGRVLDISIRHDNIQMNVTLSPARLNLETFSSMMDKVMDHVESIVGFYSLYTLRRQLDFGISVSARKVLTLTCPRALRLVDPSLPAKIVRYGGRPESYRRHMAELKEIHSEWREKMMGAVKTTRERVMVIHDTPPTHYTG